MKLKDGYKKLIGTTYLGSADRVLLSNGGDFGIHTSHRNNEANKIVITDDNGYIQTGWINTLSGNVGTASIDKIYASYDGYIRYVTPANFFSALSNDSNQLSMTIGSQNRKLTVNYAATSKVASENYNYYTVTINGDKDTYYPVLILPEISHNWRQNIITITKHLNQNSGSWDGNHTSDISKGASGIYRYEYRNRIWDGNCGYIRTLHAQYGYAPFVAHTEGLALGNGKLCIWLRGGGADYNVSCNYPLLPIEVYYDAINVGSETYPINIAPKTSIENAGIYNSNSVPINILGSSSIATKQTYLRYVNHETSTLDENECIADYDSFSIYRANSSVEGGYDGYIMSLNWIGSRLQSQIFVDADPTHCMALRHRNLDGVWTTWKKFAFLTDIPTSHSSNFINSLTGFNAGTSTVDLSTDDSLNTALSKLQAKANLGVSAYNLVNAAYDGDNTIENLNEVLKVLEGIKDTDTINALLGKYLPLTGGTLSNASYEGQLTIKRDSEGGSGIKYENSTGYLGSIGITRNKYAYVTYDHGNSYGLLYHTGNKPSKSDVGLGNVQNTAFYPRNTMVNGTTWGMAGTYNSATFTIYAPTTTGTSGQVLTSSGATPTWSDQSSLNVGTAKALYGNYSFNTMPNDHPGGGGVKFYGRIIAGADGLFPHNSNNNTNALLSLGRHAENYWSQLGFSNNSRIYYRSVENAEITTGVWKELAYTSDIPDVSSLIEAISVNKGLIQTNYDSIKNLETIVSDLYNNSIQKGIINVNGIISNGVIRGTEFTGSAASASYLTLNYCTSSTNSGLWESIKNGNTNPQTNKVNFYTIYNDGGPSTYGELLEILSYNASHWQPQLWFGAGTAGRLYYRNKSYNDDNWGNWRTVAWTSDVDALKNYYWANIKISSESSTTSTPTFLSANITKNIQLSRSSGSDYGSIAFYSSSFNTWQFYMSPASKASSGIKGNITAPSGTYVTSWALRSLIENNSGYGWTWESTYNGGTNPTVMFEIRSSDGTVRSKGDIYSDSNIIASGKLYSTSSASSWLQGQQNETAALNITNATNISYYFPWIRQTNTSSNKWFSIGHLNNSLYFIGSDASRTENFYDYAWEMNFSDGYMYGNFRGNLIGTSDSSKYLLNQGTLNGVEEVDAFIESGKMKYATVSNFSNLNWVANDGVIVSIPYNSNFGVQLALDDQANSFHIRTRANNIWNTWSKVAFTSDIPASLPANGGNADTVDSQHFTYANESNTPTYLWGSNSTGHNFLASRANMNVGGACKLVPTDDRDVTPAVGGLYKVMAYFYSTANAINGYGTYSDMLYLSTCADSSGGDANALLFTKDTTQRIIHLQGAYNGTSWSSTKVLAYLDDIPSVNNGTLSLKVNGTTKLSFSANQSSNKSFNIENGTSITGNGTISVDGNAVSVYGLGSNAYTSTTIPTTYIKSASVSGNILTITPSSGNAITFTTNNNYTLPEASASTLGGIKIGYTTNGTNYKVQLDSNDNAYVTVPWVEYSIATASNAGLVKPISIITKPTIQTTTTTTSRYYGIQMSSDGTMFVNVPWTNATSLAGSSNSPSTKLFLIGGKTQSSYVTTYSNVNCYIGTDNCLYSNGNKVLTEHQTIPSLSGGSSATAGEYVSGVTVSGHTVTVSKGTLPTISYNQSLARGTKIGVITIDGVATTLYAPDGNSGTPSTAVPIADTETGSYGSSLDYARADHAHPKGLATIADSANKIKVTTSSSARYILSCNTSSSNSAVSVSTGTPYILSNAIYASGGFYESSDIRLKNIIKPLDIDLNIIKKIPKIYYTLKSDTENKQHIGTIAQELLPYFPEVVTQNEDGRYDVNYSHLVMVALAAIDKLIDENRALKRELRIINFK